MELDTEQRNKLICRNLKEICGGDILCKIVANRPLNLYWGTAPTGRIHLGYFVPMLKIADFLKAGCNVTILFADLHAFLDNMKSDFAQLNYRTQYYENMIKEMLKVLNVDVNKLRFVRGTDFQLDKPYTMDVYRLNSLITVNTAKHAGAEVVKQTDNPLMTGLLYPTLQALDEAHLGVDAQFGGIDQRKIFMLARDTLPKLKSNPYNPNLKYNKRIHLMNEMIPGITTSKTISVSDKKSVGNNEQCSEEQHDEEEAYIVNKMSSSNEKTKIDLLDGNGSIRKKIRAAYCLPGDDEDNCLMVILEKVLFRIMEHRGEPFIISRKEEHGGDLTFNTIDEVREMYKRQELHPDDFKNGIILYIVNLLAPIKSAFDTKELKVLLSKSY